MNINQVLSFFFQKHCGRMEIPGLVVLFLIAT